MNIPKNTIVSTAWLNEHLHDDDLVVLNASKSTANKDRRNQLQIIGSRTFNIKEDFSDTASKYPNMLCSPKQFEMNCRKLGINKSSKIIIYDDKGISSSPRAWWMFKTMGHEQVAVLDGGLPRWLEEGYPTEQVIVRHHAIGNFNAAMQADNVKHFEDIQSNIVSPTFLVIDARSKERFHSLVEEPRQGLRRGNISNSINIPYTEVLMDGMFKPANKLKDVFKTIKDNKKECAYSCGSGGSACVLLLAAEIAGVIKNTLYDGSWTEWAQRSPI